MTKEEEALSEELGFLVSVLRIVVRDLSSPHLYYQKSFYWYLLSRLESLSSNFFPRRQWRLFERVVYQLISEFSQLLSDLIQISLQIKSSPPPPPK